MRLQKLSFIRWLWMDFRSFIPPQTYCFIGIAVQLSTFNLFRSLLPQSIFILSFKLLAIRLDSSSSCDVGNISRYLLPTSQALLKGVDEIEKEKKTIPEILQFERVNGKSKLVR